MRKINSLLQIKIAFLFVVFCNAFIDTAHKVLLQNIAFKIFDGPTQVIWISIINALIIIPFLLLFTLSGYLSDKYNKKDILIYGSVSSFLLSILMIISYMSNDFYFAMFCLFLLAVQSAIYSPAKFGIIMDIYGKKYLSRGNAALQSISIISILLAIGAASFIFEAFYIKNNLINLSTKEELLEAILPLTYYILPFAFLEMMVSFMFLKKLEITHTKNDSLTLDKKEFFKGKLLGKNIKAIFKHDVIFMSVIGLSIFWGVSQGIVAVFPSYAKSYLNISDVFIVNGVIASSAIGMAIGSIVYAKLSKHYIELGTIPFASFGMAFSIYISTIVETPLMLGLSFLFFGFYGGLFIVPLNALIQFNSRKRVLGTVLAGNNWFHSIAMFLMLCFTTAVAFFDFDSLSTIYLILAVIIVGTFYTVYKLPQSLVLLFLKFIVGIRYKLEVIGIKNIPSSGGVLLLGNHISWIDWAIVLMAVPREVKFVIYKPIYDKWYLTWLLKLVKAIPISNAGSKASLQRVAKELDNGHVVVLFPEGSITRNGHLGEFRKGFEKVLFFTQTDVKVIPFYIRGLWESMFSRANKKFKKSKRTNIVSVCFGKTINKEESNSISIKKEVFLLSSLAWREHLKELKPLNETIFDRLKEVSNKIIFADSTGVELSANKFLTACVLFKSLLKKRLKKEENIAILLPSSVASAIVNYTLLLMGKTAVNLNYTSKLEAIKYSIVQSEVKTIISSRKFLEKLSLRGIDLEDAFEGLEVLFMEDLKSKINKIKSIITLLSVSFLPSFILKTLYLKKTKKDASALILFSSGSEGIAKGILLSGDNILGNAQQIANIINVNDEDVILGSLPSFHAFGIVVTTFLPLIEGIKCVAHPDPTDGFGIAKLVHEQKVTVMFGTSTFFRLYAKNSKIESFMFDSLRLVISGAEKLRHDVKFEFKRRFGKDILEGYGTTETSPVASCNLLDSISEDFEVQIGQKDGSVGMAIPGTTIKVVDPKTFEELKVNEEGMIIISGIQVMKGYLKNEAKTKEVLKTIKGLEYYITQDKGKLDEDGFLTIVDRYSRFAKIGGEMISLANIEEQISKLLEPNSELDFVTTVLDDEKKGEKIVLLISNISQEEVKILKGKILKSFDNKLMIPSKIKIVEDIPKLGSGKKDYGAIKILACSN